MVDEWEEEQLGLALGRTIQRQMESRGFTIESFAVHMGVNWRTVSRWRAGHATPQRTGKLVLLCQVLDIDLRKLA